MKPVSKLTNGSTFSTIKPDFSFKSESPTESPEVGSSTLGRNLL